MIERGLLCATFLVAACGAAPSDGPMSNIAAAVQPASNTSEAQSAVVSKGEPGGNWLIFEFPDGRRGGTGRIQGQVPPSLDFTRERLVERIRACGARDARLVIFHFHSAHVISRSTPRNREIVRCVMQTIPHHFDAGIGSDDPREFFHMDETPFREFATATDSSN